MRFPQLIVERSINLVKGTTIRIDFAGERATPLPLTRSEYRWA